MLRVSCVLGTGMPGRKEAPPSPAAGQREAKRDPVVAASDGRWWQ
jgi:hypothetical protein